MAGTAALASIAALPAFTRMIRSHAVHVEVLGPPVAGADADVVVEHVHPAVPLDAGRDDAAAVVLARDVGGRPRWRASPIVSAVSRADASSRSASTTVAPSRANAIAVARPLPMP